MYSSRRLGRLAALTLVGIALSLALVVGSSPAHAAIKHTKNSVVRASGPAGLPYVTTFHSLATGYALDSNFYGNVYAIQPNGGNYQKWYVSLSDYGTVTLRDVATWRCLDSNTSRQVYTLPCNGGAFQKWIVLNRDYGTVVLKDLATGFVLDGNGEHSVYTMPENGGSYQKFIPFAS